MPSAGQVIEGVGLGVSFGKEVPVDVDTEVWIDGIRKGATCSVVDILTTESVEVFGESIGVLEEGEGVLQVVDCAEFEAVGLD